MWQGFILIFEVFDLVNLFVLGALSDNELAGSLYRALSPRFQTLAVHAGSRVEHSGAHPDFLLLECENAHPNPDDRNIIICKSNFTPCGIGGACKNTVGIVQSDNIIAAKALSRQQIPVISCGMAATDTLTFSSMCTDSTVVCLQRSIPTLYGGTVEPVELRLALSHTYQAYTLMCITAVLLLADKLDASREILL